jgi:hypothetical protein
MDKFALCLGEPCYKSGYRLPYVTTETENLCANMVKPPKCAFFSEASDMTDVREKVQEIAKLVIASVQRLDERTRTCIGNPIWLLLALLMLPLLLYLLWRCCCKSWLERRKLHRIERNKAIANASMFDDEDEAAALMGKSNKEVQTYLDTAPKATQTEGDFGGPLVRPERQLHDLDDDDKIRAAKVQPKEIGEWY